MKDSQYFSGQQKTWNGGVMSTSGGGGRREEGGRGGGSYPPWPPAHHPMHHHHLQSPPSSHSSRGYPVADFRNDGPSSLRTEAIQLRIKQVQVPIPYRWIHRMPRMMGGYYGGRGVPPSTAYTGGGWARPSSLKPPERWAPVVGSSTGGQAEGGMDLSQSRPNGSQPNGVAKEPVSVIATNPLRSSDKPLEPSDRSEDEDEDCMVIEEGEEAPRTGELPPHRVLPRHLPESTRQQAPSIGLEAPSIAAPPAHQNPSIAGNIRPDQARAEPSQLLPPRQEPARPESTLHASQRMEPARQEAPHLPHRQETPRLEASHHLPQRVEQATRSESSLLLAQRLEASRHLAQRPEVSLLIPQRSDVARSEKSHHLPISVSQPLRSDTSSSVHSFQKLSGKESSLPNQQALQLQIAQQILLHKQIQDSGLQKLPDQLLKLQESACLPQQITFQTRQDTASGLTPTSQTSSDQRKEEPPASLKASESPDQPKQASRSKVEPISVATLCKESIAQVPKAQNKSPQHKPPLQQSVECASLPSQPSPGLDSPHQEGLEPRPDIASLPPQVQPRPAESAASMPQPVFEQQPVEKEPSLPMQSTPQKQSNSSLNLEPAAPPVSITPVKVKEEEESVQCGVDHVESMLENMFQQDESPTPTVRPIERKKSPLLTDDKVVEILQDQDSSIKEEEEEEEDKLEIKKAIKAELANSTPQKSSNTFMQVESELEKMFAGIVETPGDSDKPETPESSKSSKKSSAKRKIRRQRTKKRDVESAKKQRNKSPNESLKLKRRFGPKLLKEGSNDSSIVSVYKSRGPLIRVAKDKDGRPATVTIVNSSSTEEDRDRSMDLKIKRKAPRIIEGRTKGPGLFSSTLSSKYNSNTIDVTWTCVFCNRRSHCENGLGGEPAGDLFGPYLVHIKLEPIFGGPSDADVANEQRKRGGGKQLSLRAGGQANHSFMPPTKKKKSGLIEKESTGNDGSGVVTREVWVHEACAVWSPGVILVGPHLIGLDDAVSISLQSKCSVCGESGACISCLHHGCHRVCHYGCARATQWSLDEETFHARCINHKKPITLSFALHQNSA